MAQIESFVPRVFTFSSHSLIDKKEGEATPWLLNPKGLYAGAIEQLSDLQLMDDTLDRSDSRATTIDTVKATLYATREEISGRILRECWRSDDRELMLRL